MYVFRKCIQPAFAAGIYLCGGDGGGGKGFKVQFMHILNNMDFVHTQSLCDHRAKFIVCLRIGESLAGFVFLQYSKLHFVSKNSHIPLVRIADKIAAYKSCHGQDKERK